MGALSKAAEIPFGSHMVGRSKVEGSSVLEEYYILRLGSQPGSVTLKCRKAAHSKQ